MHGLTSTGANSVLDTSLPAENTIFSEDVDKQMPSSIIADPMVGVVASKKMLLQQMLSMTCQI